MRWCRERRQQFGSILLFIAVLMPTAVFAATASVTVPVLDTASMRGTIDESWAKAAKITLDTDSIFKRPAEEPTTVYLAQEGGFLDVAFDVTQKSSQTAAQETNSSSVMGDDYVGVYLYPQGTSGLAYSFEANPHGARYQTSSENTSYTPQWTAVGKGTPTGYVVTMRIPLGIIRSGGSKTWRAQFVRSIGLRRTASPSGRSIRTSRAVPIRRTPARSRAWNRVPRHNRRARSPASACTA